MDVDNMAEASHDDASQSWPGIRMSLVKHRWFVEDLQMLRSGLFADAMILCDGDATPRKVHRNILVERSTWFKKAFLGQFSEANERKIKLQETPWRVDLMLYFFYTGGIDMDDEALTDGHGQMDIAIELLRLGDFFQSTSMLQYGKSMLAKYLAEILYQTCDINVTYSANEAWFKAKADFPIQLCGAIVNAFDENRPVKPAQDMLADFAFTARIHLFQNQEFVSFITDKVVPEFANHLLTALITGSVSDVFNGQYVFKQWQDWKFTPQFAAPAQPAAPSLFGPSPRVASGGSGTTYPQVNNASGGRARGFLFGSSTANTGSFLFGSGTGSRTGRRLGGMAN